MNRERITDRVFTWAKEQLLVAAMEKDITAAKKAVVLAAICIHDEAGESSLKAALQSMERTDFFPADEQHNIHFDLPFFIAYHQLMGHLPVEVKDRLERTQLAVKREIEENEDWKLLGTSLLLNQLAPMHLTITPPADLTMLTDKPLPYYLSAGNHELNSLVHTIMVHSGFGTQQLTGSDAMLVSILEVRMIAALRNYDLIQACSILQVLHYMGVSNSGACDDTLMFLVNNQAEEGFIGYYEREFLKMNINTPASRRSFQLSSTLMAVITLLECTSDYRFHSDMFRTWDAPFIKTFADSGGVQPLKKRPDHTGVQMEGDIRKA